MTDFVTLLENGLSQRRELLAELEPKTDCYRLFHGATEGRPGLAVDRYGPQLLIQTWQELLEEKELEQIVAVFSSVFPDGKPHVVYNHRGEGRPPAFHYPTQEALAPTTCKELGVVHRVLGRHKGQDPLLFLDFRVARRWLKDNAAGKSVLNTFSYTCGAGVAAAVGGATEVWNVDFARFATDIGAENARLNGMVPRFSLSRQSGGPPADVADHELKGGDDNIGGSQSATDFRILVENYFPVIWQLGGQKLKGRAARRRKYLQVPRKKFDIIVLDPPRWARTPWGAVDVVRDYQSLFKPCVYAANPEGTILCTNHVPGISTDDWVGDLERCAEKAGHPLAAVETLEPEADFPSPDGQHPLKIAVARLAP